MQGSGARTQLASPIDCIERVRKALGVVVNDQITSTNYIISLLACSSFLYALRVLRHRDMVIFSGITEKVCVERDKFELCNTLRPSYGNS